MRWWRMATGIMTCARGAPSGDHGRKQAGACCPFLAYIRRCMRASSRALITAVLVGTETLRTGTAHAEDGDPRPTGTAGREALHSFAGGVTAGKTRVGSGGERGVHSAAQEEHGHGRISRPRAHAR